MNKNDSQNNEKDLNKKIDDEFKDTNLEVDDEDSYEEEEIIFNQGNPSIKEQIYNLDIRSQEIDAILEKYEDILFSTGEETLSEEEVKTLKNEYKQIRIQKKSLLKQEKKSTWDNIPLWMGAYAVFQILFSFFYIITKVSMEFAGWISDLFSNKVKNYDTLYLIMLFVIPFISLLISLILLLIIKNKTHKKVFGVIYILQALETITAVIFMIVALI